MYRISSEGAVLIQRVELADTFWCRCRGLLLTSSLAQGSGLLLRPCSAVHTVGMRYPIDIVFISEIGLVLKTVAALRPNRIAGLASASQVLELAEGEVRRLGIHPLMPLQLQWQLRVLEQ